MAYVIAGGGAAHLVAGSTDSNTFTTPTLDTTGADLIVITLVDLGTIGACALSDNKGNTGSYVTRQTLNSQTTVRLRQIECLSPTVGAGHTWTCTGTGTFPALCVQAWTGGSASTFDTPATNGATGTGVSTLQTGSVTPSNASSLLISGSSNGSIGNTFSSIDSGFTLGDSLAEVNGAHFGIAIASLVETSIVTKNPTWTYASASNFVAASIATYFTGGGGGGATSLFRQSLLNGLGVGGPFFNNPLG